MFLKWIKALFLSEPEYIKHSEKPKRKPTMERNVEYVYSPNAKTEFRFPVTVDSDKKVENVRDGARIPKSEPRSSINKVVPFKEQQSPNRYDKEEVVKPRKVEIKKAPFSAREIPSPTHGFLPRNQERNNEEGKGKDVETVVSVKAEEGGKAEQLVQSNEVLVSEREKLSNEEVFEPGLPMQDSSIVVETVLHEEEVSSPESLLSMGGVERGTFVVGEESVHPVLDKPIESQHSNQDVSGVPAFNYEVSEEVEEDMIGEIDVDQIDVTSKEMIEEVDVEMTEDDAYESPALQSEELVHLDEERVQNSVQIKRNEASGQSDGVEKVEEKPKNTAQYNHPSLSMLKAPVFNTDHEDETWMLYQMEKLETSLRDFHVKAEVVDMQQGPSITRFEVQPAPGVKVNKITNLSDDLKLSLAAKDIRIQAPIPGKSSVGIEIPNKEARPVMLREVLESEEFNSSTSPLTVALGMDISGAPIVTDLNKMPHGLIAGATGSGKSVCINTMLVSLLYKASPEEVKLLLIDPKMVELTPYNDLPHLVSPVITDPKTATKALKWAVDEMESRYQKFVKEKVRDIQRYNEKAEEKMPYLVVVIDELADLMMVSPSDVEDAICRIAQKARACGIHLLVATQRPSVDVITGLIKANIPTRIAFAVSSQTDSRTILDEGGAEKLLGKGDMLFSGNGAKSVRLQGNFVSDEEIEGVTEFIKEQQEPEFLFEEENLVQQDSVLDMEDELFVDACEFVIEQGTASSSGLQRKFRVGYNRAARLIDMMEDRGIVSAANGSKPREVLVSIDQFYELTT
ncbi:DNA translocase FtsK (plasmid) [Rossellomorea sp. AcN35-11]|nr:DNA translocase FtsK [Rossellomorea aquimaris]WJV32178.1 DNA translocase FtsK [Rossellomorea sp. AcN35-11]